MAAATSRVRSVRRISTRKPPELEIAYGFGASARIRYATLRVPIPAGRVDEADALASRYLHGGWYVDAVPAETPR